MRALGGVRGETGRLGFGARAYSGAMTRERRPAWPWVVVIVGLVVLNLTTFLNWSGECVDYVGEASALSYCSSGPAVGWPQVWVIAALSLLGVLYSAYRIARRNR